MPPIGTTVISSVPSGAGFPSRIRRTRKHTRREIWMGCVRQFAAAPWSAALAHGL